MLRRWRRTERERARDAHALTVDERRLAWAVCSALLEYPGEDLIGRIDDLAAATGSLPPAYADPLVALLGHLREGDLMALQALLVLGGVGEPLRGRLWTFDALTGRVRVLKLG